MTINTKTILATSREDLAIIRHKLHVGEIDYQQAKVEAAPILEAMNERGAEIAKQHGQKYRPLTFTYVMR
jgi:hypothetical protein